MNSTDDYYDYNKNGFESYVFTTIDPGPWMLFGVSIYSCICVIVIPPLVILGNRYEKRRLEKGKWKEDEDDSEGSETVGESTKQIEGSKDTSGHSITEAAAAGEIETKLMQPMNGDLEVPAPGLHARFEEGRHNFHKNPYSNTVKSRTGHKSVVSAAFSGLSKSSGMSARTGVPSRRHGHGKAGFVGRFDMFQRAIQSEGYSPNSNNDNYNQHQHPGGGHGYSYQKHPGADVESAIGFGSSVMGRPVVDDLRPEDAADANDPGKELPFRCEENDGGEEEVAITLFCGRRSLCSPWAIKRGYETMLTIAYPDRETKRIISLGVPFTFSALSGTLFDTFTVIIISHYRGTDVLTAYVLVELLIGITDNFIQGVSSCLETLCSHAIGNDNWHLAGQYIQIATVFYLLVGVPMLGMWRFIIGDIVQLMGMNENVTRLTVEYTQIVIYDYLLGGLFAGWGTITDITGHEVFGAYVEFCEGLVGILFIWLFCVFFPGYSLFWIGVTHLTVGFLSLIIWLSVSLYKGWFDPFLGGFFSSNAFRNKLAVWNVIQTAVPLGFGSLLEYGEWEILTFIVAVTGPAEIAAWGILGSLWEVFESATEGLSEAACIRVAFHLGTGNAELAKQSAYKSLFLCVNLSVSITCILFICGDSVSGWYTQDSTLRQILDTMIPMIGVGNIFMVFGMVSWGLVGAQGRYRLATCISVFSSWFVTIPVALFFSIYCNFDLSGIVAAVIVGYSTSGMIQAYILLRSDWGHIAKTIQEYNTNEEISLSDDSSSESSDDE